MQNKSISVKFIAISFFITIAIVGFYNTVSATEVIPRNLNCIRSITMTQIESLAENSVWRQEPSFSNLYKTLSEDPASAPSAEQVWIISKEEFADIKEWCLSQKKGSETNREFLDRFSKHKES